jgi:ATP-dependent protease ClpP protease subunit
MLEMAATPESRHWYTLAAAPAAPRSADLHLYGVIGGWWGGISADRLVQELANLDVDEIRMRVHSPGGDAFDGVAIYNALVRHKARVVATVDGLAASAASLILMSADDITVGQAAQIMVHDPWSAGIGNPAELRKEADNLDRTADGYAAVYAKRSGNGTTADWREVMGEETWYNGAEAVNAGLADHADGEVPAADDTVDTTGTGPEPVVDAEDELARVVRRAFRYSDRSAAPAPTLPTASARAATVDPTKPVTPAEAARRIHAASLNKTPGQPAGQEGPKEGAAEMQFTDEERTTLRGRYSLPADADDDAIKAALMAAPAATPPSTEPADPPVKAGTLPPGMRLMSDSAWQAQQDAIKRLEARDAKRERDERDGVLAQAVKDGKFTPAQRDHFAKLWDADPEGTRALIGSLQKNTALATAAVGHSGDVDSDQAAEDAEFDAMFPPHMRLAGKGA